LETALVAIPFAMTYSPFITQDNWKKWMLYYVGILFAATLYCLINAMILYTHQKNVSVFFYHSLVSIFPHNAIQFSILVFLGIVFLMQLHNKGHFAINKWLSLFLIAYFSFFLLLLSSKLIISILTFYFLYGFAINWVNSKIRFKIVIGFLLVLMTAAVVFFTKNPISNRFSQETSGKLDLVKQRKFDPGVYFNGLQFRLLEWRFTYETLNENHKWLTGVSQANAQTLLDRKYVETNMFTGGVPGNEKGFIGYNTHNQFLQSLLQTGVPGLLAFLLACIGLVSMALKRKNTQLSFLVIALLAYSFSESVLETQYGLILFVFFPLFFYCGTSTEPFSKI
jgi:O-antigen ligase